MGDMSERGGRRFWATMPPDELSAAVIDADLGDR
jgi:hypothetical protein